MPDPPDPGEVFVQLLPQGGRTADAHAVVVVIGPNNRRGAVDDGTVSMQHCLHPEDRMRAGPASVVTFPFPERAFHSHLGFRRRYLSLQDYLRPGGNGQVHRLASDHLFGAAPQEPGIIVFADPQGHSRSGNVVKQRVDAAHRRRRTGQAPVPVFLQDDVAVPAGQDMNAGGVLVQYLHAVGAEVDPSRVRVFLDEHVPGADIAPAVQAVPSRRRKLEEVYFISQVDIFFHRAAGHGHRGDGGESLLHPFPEGPDQSHSFQVQGETGNQGHAAR